MPQMTIGVHNLVCMDVIIKRGARATRPVPVTDREASIEHGQDHIRRGEENHRRNELTIIKRSTDGHSSIEISPQQKKEK